MRRIVGVMALAACGRVGFEPVPDGTAVPTVDAFDDSLCTWSPPAPLVNLNTADSESEPALSPDGQTLVFTSDRVGGQDRLFVSTRVGGAWSAPTRIAPLDGPNGTGGAAWNATGDRLYLSSYRAGPLHLYEATVSGGVFGPPVLVPGLEALTEQVAPTVRADELEMFYSSRLPPSQIERATRPSTTAPWQPQGAVTELSSAADTGYPGVTSDGRTLYFEASRPGGFTIKRAVRATVDAPFAAPVLVGELDGGNSDGDPQTSTDGTQMLLSSDRAEPGNFDLYLSTRSCP